MKTNTTKRTPRRVLPLAAGLALLALAPGAAFAHTDVVLGVNLGGFVEPAYAPPPPVYYESAPQVYYEPAPRVYYTPRPAYYGYGYQGHRGYYRDDRDDRHHHDHREHHGHDDD